MTSEIIKELDKHLNDINDHLQSCNIDNKRPDIKLIENYIELAKNTYDHLNDK